MVRDQEEEEEEHDHSLEELPEEEEVEALGTVIEETEAPGKEDLIDREVSHEKVKRNDTIDI